MKKPDFFIVGAPKCGTTSLCNYLSQHPDVFIPPAKELHYFGADLTGNKKAKNLKEYLNFFKNGQEQTCGEGSTWYLFSKLAAKEISNFNPNAKIIVMLRDPVSLLYSLHSQRLVNGSSENITNFKKALEAEKERRLGKRIPKKCMRPEGLLYSEVVKFTEQIQRYFDTFGRDRVRVIVFDDFKTNTPQVYRKTLEFLGVSPDFKAQFPRLNVNKRVWSFALQRFVRFPPSSLEMMGRHLVPLPPDRRQHLWNRFAQTVKQLNTYEAPRPELDPELRWNLQQKFAPEVYRLSTLLGRDLTYWSQDRRRTEPTIDRTSELSPSWFSSLEEQLWHNWI